MALTLVISAGAHAGDIKYLPLGADSVALSKHEMAKVISYFRKAANPQRLEAAHWLIENMEGHSYVTYRLYDTSDTDVELDPLSFPTYDSLEAWARTVESERGEIDYGRKDKFEDRYYIKANFLIGHINSAFHAWRNRPWAKEYSWEQFRDYVLPYRGSNEPLEAWRQPFLEMFDTLAVSMKDSTDPVEAAALINSAIREWFKFDPRYYWHPTDQGMSEMLESKLGRCEDMTNLTIFALRANGIPVTSDYTPAWANTGNNHAWNAIVLPSGEVVPFMGAEANPGEYELVNKFAKVYRKMYAKQSGNLAFVDHPQEKMPRWLAGKNYIDVTSEYVNPTMAAIQFEGSIPDSVGIVYACVFNSGRWQPIAWADIQRRGDNTFALFKDLAPGVMLLPVLYLNEEISPIGLPFVADHQTTLFGVESQSKRQTIVMTSTTKGHFDYSTRSVKEAPLEDGRTYELKCWSGAWLSVGKAVAEGGEVRFEEAPVGCIYWMVAEDSGNEERIFTFDSRTGKVSWW